MGQSDRWAQMGLLRMVNSHLRFKGLLLVEQLGVGGNRTSGPILYRMWSIDL